MKMLQGFFDATRGQTKCNIYMQWAVKGLFFCWFFFVLYKCKFVKFWFIVCCFGFVLFFLEGLGLVLVVVVVVGVWVCCFFFGSHFCNLGCFIFQLWDCLNNKKNNQKKEKKKRKLKLFLWFCIAYYMVQRCRGQKEVKWSLQLKKEITSLGFNTS